MKANELMEILKGIPKETELNFYLIPNDGREEDGDQDDQLLENITIINSAGVEDVHDGEPYLDFGIKDPLRRFDDFETTHNIDDFISRKTDEDISFSRHENKKDIIILDNGNFKVGLAEILTDFEMQDREYIVINHNVIYLDNMSEL